MNKRIFTILIVFPLLLLVSCGVSKEAKAVDNLIAAIEDVSIDSETAILEAEVAYSSLSAEDKEQVTSYETLLLARSEYNQLKADAINEELLEMSKKKTVAQKETEQINELITDLPEEVQELVDKQLLEEAVEIRKVEKSAIVAVDSLMGFLKNKSSLNLYEVRVKEGIGPNGEDIAILDFSAGNGFGVDVDGSECIDIDTTNWTTPAFSIANFYKYMSGEKTDLGAKMTMLYYASGEEEILVDVDRIMDNLDIAKK